MAYSVSDMIIEVYENLGESSDLYPYGEVYGTVDLAMSGTQMILKWLNRAFRKICNSQLSDGTLVRFRSLERHAFFTQNIVNSTIAAYIDTTHIQVAGLSDAYANKYFNWIVDLGAEDEDSTGTAQHLVIASDTSDPPILTLATPIATAPEAGDAVNVFKKFFACSLNSGAEFHTGEFIPSDPHEDFGSVLWIYDMQSMRDIKRYDQRSPLRKSVLAPSYPGMFWDIETPSGGWYTDGIAKGIEFDLPPANGLTFEVHYYGMPEELTALAQIPSVSDVFVEMIIKWATKTGLIRDREWEAQYAIRKEFEADMQAAVQDGAFRFEYAEPYLWISD
jgi:hypothetical protein